MWLEEFPLWHQILIYFGIILLALVLIAFFLIWIVFPIVFRNSKTVQRFTMFINLNIPKNPHFNHPEKHGIEGVVNFNLLTTDLNGTTTVQLGAWLILAQDETDTTLTTAHGISTASQILVNTNRPVLLYLHGVGCNRALAVPIYKILREFFLIVAVDHRGFGDSERNVELSEPGVVSDTVQVYQRIKSQTSQDVYIWGHSLGAAIAVHTVKKLKQIDHVPMGLFLESPFSTMKDELRNTHVSRLYKCCGFFECMFLKPLQKNGFHFESTTHILDVDCPVLIMHAEDDNVISYKLGKKLYEVARTKRNLSIQGSVTYHQFPPLGYQHTGISSSPKISQYIEEFIEECQGENRRKSQVTPRN